MIDAPPAARGNEAPPDIGLVSIITPVFNSEGVIGRCVDSVLAQTYPRWELVLVDDGSTDRSGPLCDELAETDPRIGVIHCDNGGPSRARNLGIGKASGRFLYFLDADDFLDPDAIATLANDFTRHGADCTASGCKWIDAHGAPFKWEAFLPESTVLDQGGLASYLERYLREPNRTPLFSCVWGKLFDADIIREHEIAFDPTLRVFEDADFNFKFLKRTRLLSYASGHGYNYTYMTYYVSASTRIVDHPEKALDHLKAMTSLADFFAAHRPGQPPARIIGHAAITLTIIQLVRLCGQVTWGRWNAVTRIVTEVVNDPRVRAYLPYYQPVSRGESRRLSVLIKHRWVSAIVLLCWYKARARYGKRCKRR